MRKALTVALVATVLGLAAGGMGAAAAAPKPSSNLTAYTLQGKRLPPNPKLDPGETVRLVVTGYGPDAAVAVRLAGTSAQIDASADASGVVTDVYTVPNPMVDGQYLLTLVGSPPDSEPTPSATPTKEHTKVVDPFVVVVPNSGFFPFRIGKGGGPTTSVSSSQTSTGVVSGTEASTGNGAGGLSNTGANVLTPLFLGLIALLIGVVSVRLGLRRSDEHPERDH